MQSESSYLKSTSNVGPLSSFQNFSITPNNVKRKEIQHLPVDPQQMIHAIHNLMGILSSDLQVNEQRIGDLRRKEHAIIKRYTRDQLTQMEHQRYLFNTAASDIDETLGSSNQLRQKKLKQLSSWGVEALQLIATRRKKYFDSTLFPQIHVSQSIEISISFYSYYVFQ